MTAETAPDGLKSSVDAMLRHIDESVKCLTVKVVNESKNKICVTLESTKDRSKILRAARKLRTQDSAYKDVYLNPDLTPMQQKHAYLLRQQRNEKNTALSDSERISNPFIVYREQVMRKSQLTTESS